jgi:[ribosomal protein S18]-alanine N-acetyltransferase
MIGRPDIRIRTADQQDADVLSEIHGEVFSRGWTPAEFEALLAQDGVHALVAVRWPLLGRPGPVGFVLYRIAADDSEILSIAVSPACRGRGIARRLMEEALRHLYRERVATLHLEVDAGNEPALGLYRRLDFEQVGARPGYYARSAGTPRGALVMRRQLR